MSALAAFVAAIEVHLKPGALDPQGQAVAGGLRALGHAGVRDVRVGKHVRVRLEAADEGQARAEVERMCRELLVNPVMETYTVTVEPDRGRQDAEGEAKVEAAGDAAASAARPSAADRPAKARATSSRRPRQGGA